MPVDLTRVLSELQAEAPDTAELFPLVYEELRRLATAHISREKPGHTLQATALVHETYLRLTNGAKIQFEDARHFFVMASEAMRRILVESARRKAAVKRGGEIQRVALDDAISQLVERPEEAIAVSDALDALAQVNPDAAELVKLHYFSGHSLEECGELLGLSRATAYRTWTYAKAWLFANLSS